MSDQLIKAPPGWGYEDKTIENMTDYEFAHWSVDKDPGLIHREHGIKNHKYVNGNLISVCQRETLFKAYYYLIKNLFQTNVVSLTIGGPRDEFPGDTQFLLNVYGCGEGPLANDYPGYNGVGIPEVDNKFHAVVTCHSLEHLKDVGGSISEMYRVLKPGGYILNVVPDKNLHRHDMSNHKPGERCYNEWSPNECLSLFSKYIERGKLELVQFDTRKNLLDFEIILRKIK